MADDSEQIGQDEIEELLRQAQAAASSASSAPSAEASAEPPPQPVAADDVSLGQDEIEAMLKQAASASASPQPSRTAAPAAPTPPPAPAAATGAGVTSQSDIELLLQQAELALASVDQPIDKTPLGATPFNLRDFTGSPASTEKATLDLLSDVDLNIRIELGRTHMYLEDILGLRKGSVVTLDKLAGDPVDVYANGRLIARGEVLVLNDNFCVRVAELVYGEEPAD